MGQPVSHFLETTLDNDNNFQLARVSKRAYIPPMQLSESEISRITEIVAGRMGVRMDGRQLRQIVDRVVDSLKANQGNPGITGVTCEVPQAKPSTPAPTASIMPYRAAGSSESVASVNDRGGLYEQIERTNRSRIIVAAFGNNRPGVVAAITHVLAENGCSIEDISQTIMQEFFSMIMIVDMSAAKVDFATLRERIQATENELGMKVYVMHEDIFRYMHRI